MNFIKQGRFGLDSYRGRYLWLVLIISIALMITAYIGNVLVMQDTKRSTVAARENAVLLSTLSDSDLQLSNLRVQLHHFTLHPDKRTQQALKLAQTNFQTAMKRLHQRLSNTMQISVTHMEGEMQSDLKVFIENINTLFSLRLTVNEWMPASQTLAEKLIPQNEAIKTHLQNIETTLDEQTDQDLRLIVSKLRSAWLNTIGELRLLVSNRFGTFDVNVKQGMKSRTSNLEQYAEHVSVLIKELKTALEDHQYEFLFDEQVGIQKAYEQWYHSYRSISVLLSQDDWRRDYSFIKNHITPIAQRIQQRLTAVRLQLQTNAQDEIYHILDNSSALAKAISLTTIAIITFFMMAYLAFNRWLFQPIQHIAEQLKKEANGTASNNAPKAMVKEMRTLVEAFEEMHNKVNEREHRLQEIAHTDPLTQLPNRLSFRKQLKKRLKQDLPKGKNIALLFLDLDRFKQVNDSHGHAIGDELLIQVSKRLRATFRSEDIVARISGDEFAVLLDNFVDTDEVERMAEKVVETLKPSFTINSHICHSSASIGMAIAPMDGVQAEQLIQHADTAMYRAKAAGRNGFCQFTHDMMEESAAKLNLENELHVAIKEQQLELFLQPIIDFRDTSIHAYECLLRWHHPKRGIVKPNDFLPTLEDIGLQQHIAEWSLEQLQESFITQSNAVSINLSAKLLYKQEFANNLEQRLQNGKLDPSKLIVEITEDSFSQEIASAAKFLGRLQKMGVRIALDDFGTGQSSLNHLRAFPFDLVKIDHSFVRDILSDEQDATLVRAIIALAKALNIKVVAEGIESPAQSDFIKKEGGQYGQGYLFGTPSPLLFNVNNEQA